MKRFPGQGGERFPGQSRIDELHSGKYQRFVDFILAGDVELEEARHPLFEVIRPKNFGELDEYQMLTKKLKDFRESMKGSVREDDLDDLIIEEVDGRLAIVFENKQDISRLNIFSYKGSELAVPSELIVNELVIYNCHNLREISELPLEIRHLIIKKNTLLASVVRLPESISDLLISESLQLEGLELPSSLEYLSLKHVEMKEPPKFDQSSIETINIENVYFGPGGLPDLPADTKRLTVNSCSLDSLPKLPSKLEHLQCRSNVLKRLPALPASLLLLDCNGNSLEMLPTLPAGLLELRCSQNPLTSLPKLPGKLTLLQASNTKLGKRRIENLRRRGIKHNIQILL